MSYQKKKDSFPFHLVMGRWFLYLVGWFEELVFWENRATLCLALRVPVYFNPEKGKSFSKETKKKKKVKNLSEVSINWIL